MINVEEDIGSTPESDEFSDDHFLPDFGLLKLDFWRQSQQSMAAKFD